LKKYFSTVFALFCFAALIICIGTSNVSPIDSATLYGKVLRLHVLANSDSEEDQMLKYKVRDGLLGCTRDLFYDCESVNEALDVAKRNKRILEKTANDVLLQNGCIKKAAVVIGKEDYPEKKYGSLTFPKGEYLSVRVLIGDGKGKNWWCVLFPPLCNAGVEDGARVLSSYGIDEKEIEKLERENDGGGIEILGCRVKLKILEFFE